MPLVSVVMPLYNKEAEVRKSVESVLTQTVSDFELIVVNDGSTDNGPEVVRSIKDNRIRIIDHENAGVSAARNRGIKVARSELIAFLDAGDVWLSGFLAEIERLTEKYPKGKVFVTRYFFQRASGTRLKPIFKGISDDFEGVVDNYFKIAYQSDPPVWSSSICVRKQALLEIGGFPVGVAAGEDLLMWARLAVRNQIVFSPQYLSIYILDCEERTQFKPLRTSPSENYVGRELEKLCDAYPEKLYIRRYCAFWYRIRASTFLAYRKKVCARKYSVRGLRCYLFDYKLLIYFFLTLTPGNFASVMHRYLRKK